MRKPAPCFEPLEIRRMLAASVVLDEGTLKIAGTDGADTVTIAPNESDPASIEVRVGNLIQVFNNSDFNLIRINTGNGADVIRLNSAIRSRSIIYGGAGDDVITGGGGRDRIRGGDGADSILGGKGHDLLFGDAGADTLIGGHGNDTLVGGADNDRLLGNDGNDHLVLDEGPDDANGGPGDDVIA